ncbi:MAG: hypothetical protein LBL00_02410 [Endomicrobium sp.]|nr:hypothetical protein [Endomicrobium sp.]
MPELSEINLSISFKLSAVRSALYQKLFNAVIIKPDAVFSLLSSPASFFEKI